MTASIRGWAEGEIFEKVQSAHGLAAAGRSFGPVSDADKN